MWLRAVVRSSKGWDKFIGATWSNRNFPDLLMPIDHPLVHSPLHQIAIGKPNISIAVVEPFSALILILKLTGFLFAADTMTASGSGPCTEANPGILKFAFCFMTCAIDLWCFDY